MDIEKKKHSEKPLYEKNTFVIVEDLTAKHDFTICLLEKSVYGKDQLIKAILLRRDEDKGVNYFRPDRQTNIDTAKILFPTEDVQLVQFVGDQDDSINELDHIKIFIPHSSYRKITHDVGQELKERGALDSQEEDLLDSSHLYSSDEFEIVGKSQRKNVLGRKKAKISKKKASLLKDSPAYSKKVKGNAAPKIKTSRKKEKPPVYKKGKINPNVTVIESSVQYEGTSAAPDFTCCKLCNNKEMLRAALTSNQPLFKKLLAAKNTLSSFCSKTGPDSAISTYSVLLQQRNFNFFFDLLKMEKEPGYLANPNFNFGLSVIDTGFNDKYAYGVATRRVEMARGNREGTNAFMYDQNAVTRFTSSTQDLDYMCRYFDSEEALMHLLTYENEIITSLETKVFQMVLFGNIFLARKLTERMYLNDGWGIGKFHFLALSAQTEADLVEMKKPNAKKKSYSNNQITPTHMACINPNPSILNRFLELSEEMYIVDEMLRKPVHYAAACHSTGPLQLLLDKGIDCRDYDKSKMTPLMYASIAGRSDNIRLMCTHVPYNVNYKSKEGQTALHYAVLNNNLESALELLNFGANINLPGRNRMTPLLIAAQKGYFEIVKTLLDKGAKILAKDKYKKSALLYAIMNGHIKIASYLLEKGSDFLAADSSGNSPVHYACAYGQWEMLELLFKAGSNINAPNSWNLAPILTALMKNHYRCVLKLTEFPTIDVNCQDNNGSTLLMSNVSKFTSESFNIAKFLIQQKNANVNTSDFSGNTALHMLAMRKIEKQSTHDSYAAAKAQYDEDVQLFKLFFGLLVSSGIDVNQRNLKSYTPIDIAVDCQNWLFMELIHTLPNINWSAKSSSSQTFFHNCHKLFYYKHGKEILESTIRKVWKDESFHGAFDISGYNFYHSILTNFLKGLPVNEFLTIYSNKVAFYQSYLSAKSSALDEEARALLLSKIHKAESKKISRFNSMILEFEQFNEFLRSLDYDFAITVPTVKEPYNDYQNRISGQSGNQVKFSSSGSFRNYLSNYTATSYNINNQETTPMEKKVDYVINNDAGCSIIHLAMIYPHKRLLIQLFKILMEMGRYRVNHQNYFGETVFYYFAKYNNGNSETVKMLLEAGEDPDIPTYDNQYPFILICQKDNRSAFTELLSKNIKLDIIDKNGTSPLIHFAKSRKLWEVQQLLQHKANVNILDAKRRNALHWAINNNSSDDTDFNLEECLIDYKIDMNALDVSRRTPLHYFFCKIADPLVATTKDPIEIVSDFLVNKNVQIDATDDAGNSPLIYAAQRGAYLCVGMLYKRGADINRQNNDSNTALAVALLYNKIDVAVYLLQQKAEFASLCYDIDFKARLTAQRRREKEERQSQKLQIEQSSSVEVRESELAGFLAEAEDSELEENDNETSRQNTFGGPKRSASRRPPFSQPSKKTRRNNFGMGGGAASNEEEDNGQGEKLDAEALKKRNFVRKELSVFELALTKKADSVTYLLIDSGFQIGRAVFDSLNANLFNYAIKLLNKKVDKDLDRNAQAFNFISSNQRSLFHAFALNSSKIPLASLDPLFDLMLKKNISLNIKDAFGVQPILYAAFKSKSTHLIERFIASGVPPTVTDVRGNTLISYFIQNNSVLMDSFKQSEGQVDAASFKQPINIAMSLPKNVQFGGAVFQQLGSMFLEQRQQEESMFMENVHNKQSQFSSQDSQLAWIKSLIEKYEIPLDRPFKLIKNKAHNITTNESFEEVPSETNLLFYAVKKLQNTKLLELLIANGINLNMADEKGFTILTWAIKKNNIVLVMFLLQHQQKIDFNLRDAQGKTYIHHIVSPLKNASYQNVSLLEYFAGRVNVDVPDAYGYPPLYYALQQDSGVMANHLRMLGASALTLPIRRMPTSVVSTVPFADSHYDFESDHLKYVQYVKAKELNNGFEIEEKPKPDYRAKGEFEMSFDASNQAYDVKLIKVDVHYGNYSANVYYIMQLLYDRIRRIFVLFTCWGRVGTEGQYQQTPFFNKEDAAREFGKLFKEKTGNDYESRANFDKKPSKYRLIKTAPRHYHSNIVKFFDLESPVTPQSQLTSSVKALMADLTDTKLYQVVYSAFQINQAALPFGYLDKELIEKGQQILDDIKALCKQMDEGRKKSSIKVQYEIASEIREKTSEYLEIIPSAGNRTEQIPAFNTYKVNNELIRLNDLRYMEVVSRILGAANLRIKEINPLDYCYEALGVKVLPLDVHSEEFDIVKMYLKTGLQQRAKDVIRNVFAIERRGEADRFKVWMDKGNRRLLWHGTRTENLMAILYNGLRIAPSDGGYNGSNFGSAIYFSDAFQRSIPFSSRFSSSSFSYKPTYILLAEVALGKMHKSKSSTPSDQLPAECHSMKGEGRQVHEKHQRLYLSNGCMVPAGDLKPRKAKAQKIVNGKGFYGYSFEYNEYAVYDPAQVKLRYLLELDSKKLEQY